MVRVNIHDHKFNENTLSEVMRSIFSALKLIEELYGTGLVEDNWSALLNHQKVEITFSKDHKVTIQIARIN